MDWPVERTADLKITLKQCSEEKIHSHEKKNDDIRSRQLTQDPQPALYESSYCFLDFLDLCK